MTLFEHTLQGNEITRLACSKNTQPLIHPDTIVIHATGGSSAESSARYLANKATPVSAHLVIGRRGEIYQLVPFNVIAWHAGKSTHKGRTNLNRYSIGIELDNAGKLHRRGFQFFTEFGKEIMPSEVYMDYRESKLSFWHTYTEPQLNTLVKICRLLVARYPVQYFLRHSDITSRKIDPGLAFPFEAVRKQIFMSNL